MSCKPAKVEPTLQAHAEFTVNRIEMFMKKRGWQGLKNWERQLLHSAYEALGTPEEERQLLVSERRGDLQSRASIEHDKKYGF